jgi:hypothetical protein
MKNNQIISELFQFNSLVPIGLLYIFCQVGAFLLISIISVSTLENLIML